MHHRWWNLRQKAGSINVRVRAERKVPSSACAVQCRVAPRHTPGSAKTRKSADSMQPAICTATWGGKQGEANIGGDGRAMANYNLRHKASTAQLREALRGQHEHRNGARAGGCPLGGRKTRHREAALPWGRYSPSRRLVSQTAFWGHD